MVRSVVNEKQDGRDEKVENEGGQSEIRGGTWLAVAAYANQDSRWNAKDPTINRVLKNYGTMLDFFDYSGVVVQESKRLVDISKPPALGFKL